MGLPSDEEDEEDNEYDFEIPDDEDPNGFHKRSIAESFAMDDDDNDAYYNNTPAPTKRARPALKMSIDPFVPRADMRKESILVDDTCYHNQQALMTLLYAHVTQGIKVPGLFDQDTQRL
jgi:hypothetical protein